ncbi:cystatin-A isoform X1 [Microcaecilia unicolor]|uniref:Cystatin-A isoform X1 n=1 Tax=Microcaecilia unicolor TaxID=1415580 RepID=A0A6P7Y4L5_9AMPH|nr:cystatin-A isoform X1 [Microcaecilia unicolor]
MLVGGTGAVRPATPEIQALLDQIKPEYEAKTGKCPPKFKAVEYKSQVVAGTNYFVKVDTGDEFVHVRIFQSLSHDGKKLSLDSYQTNKTQHDEICYF